MKKQGSTVKLRMEDIPEYSKEKLRLEKIESEYKKVEHEFNELVFLRDNPEGLQEQAMKQLLEMEPEELAAKDNLSLTGMEGINQKISSLNSKMTVLKKMLEAQKINLDVARGKAFHKILPGYTDGYSDIVKRMAEAIIQVGNIIHEEQRYRIEVDSIHHGLSDHLMPVTAGKIGKASDRFSWAHNFLIRASEAGHIPTSMIPESNQ